MIQAAVAGSPLAVRAGLRVLLGSSGEVEVVCEGASLTDLLPLPEGVEVIVAVVDESSLPGLPEALSGLDTAAPLFLITQEADPAQLLAGLGRRVWGILPLEASAEELLAAVRALNEGLLVGSPALVEPLITRLSGREHEELEPLPEPLTGRETEVLQLLAQGLGNKGIAAALRISEHTVKFHISAIYAKLGAASRTEAVRMGVRQGLIIL
jgi:DNA-binding NarL/FixJ family response regulator